MEKENIVLSAMGHTWLLDLDGTIVKHNGYKTEGGDTFLEGAQDFLRRIPEEDMIVFITSRTEGEKELTESFLHKQGVRYNHIIYGAPYGERILVNDRKPSGLKTAIAVDSERDVFMQVGFTVDKEL